MRMITSEEIQFIDKYLENSGVDYLDVRLELIDHIASVLENQLNDDDSLIFYDAFKNYMMVNKANLLSDYEVQNQNNIYELAKRFSKNFLKPEVLFYIIIGIMLNYYFDFSLYLEKLKWIGLGLTTVSYLILYFPIEKQIKKLVWVVKWQHL